MKISKLRWGWYMLMVTGINLFILITSWSFNFYFGKGEPIFLALLGVEFVFGTLGSIISDLTNKDTGHTIYRVSIGAAVGAIFTCLLAIFMLFIFGLSTGGW